MWGLSDWKNDLRETCTLDFYRRAYMLEQMKTAQLQQQVIMLDKERMELTKERDSYKNDFKIVMANISELRRQNKSSDSLMHEYKQDFIEAGASICDLKQENETLKQENLRLQNELFGKGNLGQWPAGAPPLFAVTKTNIEKRVDKIEKHLRGISLSLEAHYDMHDKGER